MDIITLLYFIFITANPGYYLINCITPAILIRRVSANLSQICTQSRIHHYININSVVVTIDYNSTHCGLIVDGNPVLSHVTRLNRVVCDIKDSTCNTFSPQIDVNGHLCCCGRCKHC